MHWSTLSSVSSIVDATHLAHPVAAADGPFLDRGCPLRFGEDDYRNGSDSTRCAVARPASQHSTIRARWCKLSVPRAVLYISWLLSS